jgi:hypothetical protein
MMAGSKPSRLFARPLKLGERGGLSKALVKARLDRLGYAKCDRAVVPQKIRETPQFAALCPASADVLVKRLLG